MIIVYYASGYQIYPLTIFFHHFKSSQTNANFKWQQGKVIMSYAFRKNGNEFVVEQMLVSNFILSLSSYFWVYFIVTLSCIRVRCRI